MPITKFLSRIIVKRPYLNLFLLLIVTLIFAYAMLQLKFDTSLSAFVIKNDPDLAYYNKIKDLFETDETIVIGFKARDLFSKKDLEFIKQLSEKIEAIEYVRCVKSLTTTNLTTTTPEMFEVKALVERMPETKEESEIIKRHATTNYLYIKDLVSSDGCFGSLLVDIKNDPNKQRTKEVVNAIKHLLKDEAKRTNYKLYLAGDAIINYSLGEYMQRDFFVFIIPIYLIMVILMILTMGRWRDVLASLVVITLSLIWSIGSISLMGKTFNNVTIGIIPLVFCIALENIYYIHNIYYDRLRIIADKRRAFQEALVIIFMPCFFSSFTTVIGFGSLMVNTIKPIIDFGILGSITAALAFIISIVFIPSFHILLKIPADLEKEPRFKINAAKLISALSRFIDKRKKWFWAGIPLLIFICVLGILRMRVETDHLTFFHKNSEVYKSTTFIEKNLAGVSNIEITVDTHQEGKIKEPATLKEIEKLVN
ncbi:MAG: MMPL family transporter, partial [Candidatus Omnitrophota bacterium]